MANSLLEAIASLVNEDAVGVAVPEAGGVIVEGAIVVVFREVGRKSLRLTGAYYKYTREEKVAETFESSPSVCPI